MPFLDIWPTSSHAAFFFLFCFECALTLSLTEFRSLVHAIYVENSIGFAFIGSLIRDKSPEILSRSSYLCSTRHGQLLTAFALRKSLAGTRNQPRETHASKPNLTCSGIDERGDLKNSSTGGRDL